MKRALIVVLLLLPAVAAAQGDDARQKAAQLLDEGVGLYQGGDYRGALDRFEQAYQTFPSPKILFNIAGALEKLGREAEAAQAYDRFLVETETLADVPAERKESARQALAALDKRLGCLLLEGRLPPAGAVTLDGFPVTRLDRPVYVAPGRHALSITTGGNITVDVAAGEQRKVDLEAAGKVSPGVITPPPPVVERHRRRRVWTWVTAGAAVALGAGGVVAGLSADAAFDDYKRATTYEQWQDRRDAVKVRSTVANVLFVGAGAAAVGAGVLFFLEGREASVRVAPPPGGGVSVWIGVGL